MAEDPGGCTVVQATLDDWFIVAQLVERLWAEEASFDRGIAADSHPAVSAVEDAIRTIREGMVILAVVDSKPVGLLALKEGAYHGKHRAARAPFFWVDPACRDGSVARRMWEAAQTAIGDRPLQIWVSSGNTKYARVMQRWFGFRPVATIYEREPTP